MGGEVSAPEKPDGGWRLKLGVALFGLSILLPVAGVPVVTALGLSAGMTASVSGVILVAAEVIGLLAIAVMGKPGYTYIKSRVLGFVRRYGPPRKVSRLRYNIGLVMFSVPILFGWLSIYTADLIPGFRRDPLPHAIAGDILLLAGLFVLGGDFWDKIRSLFVYDAEARFTQTAPGDQENP
jgi:hypothetical protein